MRFLVVLSAVVIGISALVVLDGGGSEAAWPGDNGRIVYRDEVNGGIWIMNADGSDRQPVTTANDYWPSWAPDGSEIVFERQAGGGIPLGAFITTAIWTVDPDGTDSTEIGPGTRPSWSPDGQRIVYSLNGKIREMNADGTGDTQITQSAGFFDTAPVYRPDGSLIAFLRRPIIDFPSDAGAAGAFTPNDIWTVNPDDQSELQFTNTPGVAEGPPDWSPSGDSLTYDSAPGLIVSTFPGNVPTTIQPLLPGALPIDPVFSPDGTTIAFTLLETAVLRAPAGVGPAIIPSDGTIYTIPAGGGTAAAVSGSELAPAEF